MVYGCGNSCIKLLVFSANLVLALGGLAIFGVCLYANLDQSVRDQLQSYIDEHPELKDQINLEQYTVAVWVLAAVGMFVFVVGFLGCCGAACESRAMMFLFFVVVLVLLLVQLGLTILILVNKNEQEFKKGVREVMEKMLENKKGQEALKPVQDELVCCGSDGKNGVDCPAKGKGVSCVDALWDKVAALGTIAVVVAFLVMAVEAVTLIFSCVLMRAFAESNYGGRYYA